MKPRMNVYLTTARKVLLYSYPAIKSLFVNNQDSEIYLYIVSEDLEDEDIAEERKLADMYGDHIIILHFDEETARGRIVCGDLEHWPLGTLGCYWMFHELLPDDVDRIIALESDTVVTGSLREFYDSDMEGCYAACPDPQHKPESHRRLMERLNGDVLSFVVSLYDVKAIRRDFSLDDILHVDEYVVKEFGHSQQELTFGILFRGKIKFLPAENLCIEENRQSMSEMGYDYLKKCEGTCKVLHFSSFKDKGKPWNPVCIMPGFGEWWKYAQDSPYYKEYFLEQWKTYDRRAEETELLKKNITYRNILAAAMMIYVFFMFVTGILMKQGIVFYLCLLGGFLISLPAAVLIRRLSMIKQRGRR